MKTVLQIERQLENDKYKVSLFKINEKEIKQEIICELDEIDDMRYIGFGTEKAYMRAIKFFGKRENEIKIAKCYGGDDYRKSWGRL